MEHLPQLLPGGPAVVGLQVACHPGVEELLRAGVHPDALQGIPAGVLQHGEQLQQQPLDAEPISRRGHGQLLGHGVQHRGGLALAAHGEEVQVLPAEVRARLPAVLLEELEDRPPAALGRPGPQLVGRGEEQVLHQLGGEVHEHQHAVAFVALAVAHVAVEEHHVPRPVAELPVLQVLDELPLQHEHHLVVGVAVEPHPAAGGPVPLGQGRPQKLEIRALVVLYDHVGHGEGHPFPGEAPCVLPGHSHPSLYAF